MYYYLENVNEKMSGGTILYNRLWTYTCGKLLLSLISKFITELINMILSRA
jgi:hypothetical protein